jgi:hypothetical protein
VERNFKTAQDRLVKGLRVAGVKTIEQANQYLQEDYLAWWNQELTVEPANADDAHRALEKSHNLAASLSHVETRQVRNDYTLQWGGDFYQIAPQAVVSGLRGPTCAWSNGWMARWRCAMARSTWRRRDAKWQ